MARGNGSWLLKMSPFIISCQSKSKEKSLDMISIGGGDERRKKKIPAGGIPSTKWGKKGEVNRMKRIASSTLCARPCRDVNDGNKEEDCKPPTPPLFHPQAAPRTAFVSWAFLSQTIDPFMDILFCFSFFTFTPYSSPVILSFKYYFHF